jgi:hypothetical protein
MRMGLQVWSGQVGLVKGTQRPRGQVRTTWWQDQQDEVVDGFLVEHQNQVQDGTTWEPSHECRLAGGYNEFAEFAVVHHKTTRLLG